MIISSRDGWVLRKLLTGLPLNGEVESVSRPFLRLAELLAQTPVDARQAVLGGYLSILPSQEDADAVIMALANIDPLRPRPEVEIRQWATAADVRKRMAETQWIWPGWIPRGRIFGIAAHEGVGKTRFAFDLHRRVYLGLPWPDNQEPTIEPGRPVIVCCADGHQDEIVEILDNFGLPDTSVVFATTPDEPYDGWDFDEPALLEPGGLLECAIGDVHPWCVLTDSLTYATSRNLCDQHVMKGLKAPLVRLAQTYDVSIGLLMHLSKEGQALGRRIKGITRTLLQLDIPDPDKPEHLKLRVEKTYDKKPPPLGLVMAENGNTYDFTPPSSKEKASKPTGRSPAEEKARQFILDTLAKKNLRKLTEVIREFEAVGGSVGTFFRARDAMVAAGELLCDGKPSILRLPIKDDDNRPF